MKLHAENASKNGNDDADAKRHYWLREDFDHLMGLIPGSDHEFPNDRDSSSALHYPKSTEGAFRELRLRGLECDGALLQSLAEQGVCDPRRGKSLTSDDRGNPQYAPSSSIMFWEKQDIDAAAEWLDANGYRNPWTQFCWVSNLRYGQCVKARRVAAARFGVGFTMGFDVLGLVAVIEPPENPDDYAYLRLFPKGTPISPLETEVTN